MDNKLLISLLVVASMVTVVGLVLGSIGFAADDTCSVVIDSLDSDSELVTSSITADDLKVKRIAGNPDLLVTSDSDINFKNDVDMSAGTLTVNEINATSITLANDVILQSETILTSATILDPTIPFSMVTHDNKLETVLSTMVSDTLNVTHVYHDDNLYIALTLDNSTGEVIPNLDGTDSALTLPVVSNVSSHIVKYVDGVATSLCSIGNGSDVTINSLLSVGGSLYVSGISDITLVTDIPSFGGDTTPGVILPAVGDCAFVCIFTDDVIVSASVIGDADVTAAEYCNLHVYDDVNSLVYGSVSLTSISSIPISTFDVDGTTADTSVLESGHSLFQINTETPAFTLSALLPVNVGGQLIKAIVTSTEDVVFALEVTGALADVFINDLSATGIIASEIKTEARTNETAMLLTYNNSGALQSRVIVTDTTDVDKTVVDIAVNDGKFYLSVLEEGGVDLILRDELDEQIFKLNEATGDRLVVLVYDSEASWDRYMILLDSCNSVDRIKLFFDDLGLMWMHITADLLGDISQHITITSSTGTQTLPILWPNGKSFSWIVKVNDVNAVVEVELENAVASTYEYSWFASPNYYLHQSMAAAGAYSWRDGNGTLVEAAEGDTHNLHCVNLERSMFYVELEDADAVAHKKVIATNEAFYLKANNKFTQVTATHSVVWDGSQWQ